MSTTTITLPADHNYIASLPDGTRDELVLRSDGVAVLTERVGKVVLDGSVDEEWTKSSNTNVDRFVFETSGIANPSYGTPTMISDRFTAIGNGITGNYAAGICFTNIGLQIIFQFSPYGTTDLAAFKAWLAANPVTVIYKLLTPTTRYSADNGTTWSTTDPAAGQSAIPLQKGTNNIWCTNRLSPTITINYSTQERTRKRRISELYWLGNEPKKRITWGQLATHTWREIGSKSIQEWYFSGTAEVVENAYINYEIGEL